MKDIYFQQFKNFNQEQWVTVIRVTEKVNKMKDTVIGKIGYMDETERNVIVEYDNELVKVYDNSDYDEIKTEPVKLSRVINQDDCFDDEGNIVFRVKDRAFGHIGNLILNIV